jgi:hypothetical protein
MELDTPIGKLVCGQGLWRGRYQNERLGADVEILVEGDETGPNPNEVETIRRYLADFEENLLAFRGKLFLGWSYYPVRIAIKQYGALGVDFRSRLPFLKPKTVQDDGSVF